MRILFVSTVMAHQTHGPSRKLMLLRRALATRHDVELRVLTEDPHPDYPHDYVEHLRYPRALEPASKLLRAYRYWRRARAIHSEWAYDHLVFNDGPKALVAVHADRPRGVEVVAMVNDDDNVDRGFRQNESRKRYFWRRAMSWIERRVCHRADRTITCSAYLSARLHTGYRLAEAPAVLHPALDLAEWTEDRQRAPADRPEVLFVKSDPIRGGLRDLLQALATPVLSGRVGRLHLGGFSPERYPEEVAMARTLDTEVLLHGRLTRDRLRALAYECHVGVVASRHEAFGITAREFVAAGLHTVVSTAGGLPEACAGYAVHAFRPGDVASLTAALHAALGAATQGAPLPTVPAAYGHEEMATRFVRLLRDGRTTGA